MLASADAKARAPLAAWARGTRRLDARALESLVASVVAHVPRRPIAELPWMGSRDVLGGLEAHASLTGRLGAPRVSASLEGLGLRNRESGRRDYAPVDVDLGIRWDGEDVVAVITADERGGARRRRRARAPSGHVRGLVLGRVSARDLLRAREPVAWSLSSEVDVRDLALGPLPLPGRLTGALTGHASLRDLGVAPSLEANVRVDDLGVERVRVARADASVDARDGALAVTTRLRQADGGSADLHLDSQSLVWKRLTPEWDAAQTTRLGYALEGVRLSLLQPLARKVAKYLDVTLDVKCHVFVW